MSRAIRGDSPQYAKMYPKSRSAREAHGTTVIDELAAEKAENAALKAKLAKANAASEDEEPLTEEEVAELKITASRGAKDLLKKHDIALDDISLEDAGAEGKLGIAEAREVVKRRGLG